EAIISEIRGGGARAVSETPGGGRAAPAKHGANGHAAPAPPAGDRIEPAPAANPFRTQNLEQRLQELESASLAAPRLAWDPRRIERLVRAIGRHYPAVGQTEHTIGGPGGGKALRWRVKGYSTVYGFEAPDHLYFWSALLHYVTGNDEQPAKIAVLSHPSSRFDYRSLAGFGVDASTALRYFDVIDVNDGDLAMLRAAEQFLAEAEAEGQADQAIRVVARRLDPFWRRLTRPLSVIQTAE
ncbi:MAG: hypothetical protein KDM91_18310, partial [Verrucomicrobiae bacterium]|nr:hypothetical protein [Verrucomicrobiae bacterium]